MTDAALLAALRDCYDPALKKNIVELGLVRSARLSEDATAPGAGLPGAPMRYAAHIELLAPSADEAVTAMLRAQVENRLAGIEAISHTTVLMLPTPFPILR